MPDRNNSSEGIRCRLQAMVIVPRQGHFRLRGAAVWSLTTRGLRMHRSAGGLPSSSDLRGGVPRHPKARGACRAANHTGTRHDRAPTFSWRENVGALRRCVRRQSWNGAIAYAGIECHTPAKLYTTRGVLAITPRRLPRQVVERRCHRQRRWSPETGWHRALGRTHPAPAIRRGCRAR